MSNQKFENVVEVLYDLSTEAGKGHNLATSAGLIEISTGRLVFAMQSRVSSDRNPLAHADMLILNRAITELKKFALNDYELISVFEPSLMAISACYWVGIRTYYYYLSAKKYLNLIPWASEGDLNKTEIGLKFTTPVNLIKLEDTDLRFEKLCDIYLSEIIPKK